MLPKIIYELLPISYVAAGILVIANFDSAVGVFSGFLLFATGALVWIIRSHHRRVDNEDKRSGDPSIPFWLYEFLPFLYAALATLAVKLNPHPVTGLLAVLLFMFALWVLGLRHSHRRRQHVLF